MLLEGGKLEGASWRAPPADSGAGDAGSGGAGGCLVVGDGAELPLIQGVPADDRHLQLPEVPTRDKFCQFDFQYNFSSNMSFCSWAVPLPVQHQLFEIRGVQIIRTMLKNKRFFYECLP